MNPLPYLLPRSLVGRLVALYAASLSIFMGAGLGLFFKYQFSQNIEEQIVFGERMMNVAAQTVADSAVIGDYDTITRTLNRAIAGSDFAQAKFIDPKGGVIHVQNEAVVSLPPPQWLKLLIQERLYDVNHVITVGGKDYGVLRLVFATETVAGKLWIDVLVALALALVAFAAGVLLIRFPLKRWLGNFDRVRAHEADILSGAVNVSRLLGSDAPKEIRESFEILRRAADKISVQREEASITLNAIADGVLTADEHDRVIYCNSAAERMLGSSAKDLIGRDIRALLPAAFTDEGKSVPMQARRLEVVHPDRRVAVLDVTLSTLGSNSQALAQHVLVLRDMTEQHDLDRQLHEELQMRRRALDALHQLLGALRSFEQTAPATGDLDDLIARVTALINERELGRRDLSNQKFALDQHAIVSVTDLNGNIVYANDRFCDISGYSRAELIGNNHRLLSSGFHEASFFAELWNTISTGNVWHGQIQNRRRTGDCYWVDATIAPMMGTDGLPQQYIAIRTDITAIKNVERELARERLALSNIIEGTNVGTWEWDLEAGEFVFNQRWAEMIGCTLEELRPGTVQTWIRQIHPDDLKAVQTALQLHLDGMLPAYDCEFRIRHKAGHWVWVLVRGKLASRSTDGRPLWMAGTQMDITDRKHAEIALRESRTFLDRAERIGGVGGWELDFATNTMRWTDQTRRIHEAEPGYQPTPGEVRDRYPGEARTTLERALQRARISGERYDLELPLITRQGRHIWVRVIGTVEFDDGKPARLMGSIQDITARREMEAELRRSNELVASVIESLPCGLSVFDAEQNLVLANTEFRRLLKLPDALFEKRPVRYQDFVRHSAENGDHGHGDVETIVRTAVERLQGLAEPQQSELKLHDGMSLELRRAPMPTGGFVTTYSDASARKRAEAEVQRSARLMRAAIDAVDEAFVLYDPDDRLVFCNDKYRQIYADVAHLMVPGAKFEDIIRPGAEQGHYADAVGRVDEWVAERMASHLAANTELTQRHSNGRMLRIIERKLPDGHIVGFRIDITKLVRATEAAQAALQAKSQFLANVSHELRTPMNAILGMLTLLNKTGLTVRQADYTGKIQGAARALLGLLNEILDFSKAEAGKMTLDPHPFRIDQLLRDLSAILSVSVGAKRLEVMFDIDPTLPCRLMGDGVRLQQVLVNLSGNAIKFTSKGEVVISMTVIDRDSTSVTFEISVRDTGIGIAPENHAHIFTGFSQAETSTTRRFGGTGLGLAISRRLVTLMGGELQLESALGQGSRFHFRLTLPVVADEGDKHPAMLAAPGAMRVLVVDDNPSARGVLKRMCCSLGWTTDVADSGESALALLQTQAASGITYQAVFVDWEMPGLDGWQTTQRIRTLALPGAQPLAVMITAHGADMLAQRSEAEQALLDGFLVKPLTASMLFDAVVDGRADHAQPHPSRAGVRIGSQRLAGMRLLVAEDNLNNQQVARELLEDEGAIVQIANHGQEAVDAVAAASLPFDAVLMDLQMPVMDGFAASRLIRQCPGQESLPIIAMTANAMASDRDACLDAGMNDHVGKPFDLDQLVMLLRKHTNRPELSESQGVAGDLTLSAKVLAAANTAGVDIHAALARMGAKRAVYLATLRTVRRDMEFMPQQLRAHAQQREVTLAARLLHTLKGLAATLGATALSDEAARAERQLAGESALNELAGATDRVCTAIASTCPGLDALAQALQAGDAEKSTSQPKRAVDFDPETVHNSLRVMATQLRNADMAATETMDQLLRQLGAPLPEPWQPLDEAMAALDFERALRLCNELIGNHA